MTSANRRHDARTGHRAQIFKFSLYNLLGGLLMLAALIIGLGIYPKPALDVINPRSTRR